jgi:hypothetical protein
MCKYFSRLWDRTAHIAPQTIRLYKQQIDFPRLEAYWRKEPPRGRHAKCRCGHSDDAWQCWSRVRALELYGCGRRDNGAQMLVDLEALPEDEEESR